MATTQCTPLPHLGTSTVHFNKILVAVDFSKQTTAAVHTAFHVAKAYGSELFIVHAATPALYGTGAEPVPIETFEINLEVAQAKMSELVHQFPELSWIRNHEIVKYSDALDLIEQVIEDEKIDLVIAASHGAHGIERLALGSTAEAIMRRVRCPVLIVGPQARIGNHLFDSLLLASKLGPCGLRSAQYASAIAEQFSSTLMAVHVVEPHEKEERSDKALTEELHAIVPLELSTSVKFSTRIDHGKAGEIIPKIVAAEHSTLVLVGARGDKPFADHAPWSAVAEIIRRSSCPVLCVNDHLK